MLEIGSLKRKGGTLTRSSKRKRKEKTYITSSSTNSRRTCNEDEATEFFIPSDLPSDSYQGGLSELSEGLLSDLSKSVVSLALSDEHTVLFECSGIVVGRADNVTRFVTTASLVKALNDKRKDHDNLKVEVRHEDNVVIGHLGEYDLEKNIAAVNVENFLDLCDVRFTYMFKKSVDVVAVGRDISGKLMGTCGILIDDSRSSDDSEDIIWDDDCRGSDCSEKQVLMLSSCKIPKVCEGGPLFDFDGDFVGMNLSLGIEGTFFLPKIIVHGWLGHCTSLRDIKFPKQLNSSKKVRVGERLTVHNKDQFGDLESLGYPEPPASMLNDGVLVDTFEKPFGDIYGEGVWGELSETAASNICENVVALASFNGVQRNFACTGLFIEWNGCTTILTSASLLRTPGDENKIVENLRIEVLLPNKQRAEGTLQHYNLHHNVALVSVKDFCASQPAKIERSWRGSWGVLAVGRSFVHGSLMAARGVFAIMVAVNGNRHLEYTTCRISKAGIGGPLLDFCGKFVGMNFYDKEGGTPYLPCDVIHKVLENFKTKGTDAQVGHDDYASRVLDWRIAGVASHYFPNTRLLDDSWPVPRPYWCHLDNLDKHDPDHLGEYDYQILLRRCGMMLV